MCKLSKISDSIFLSFVPQRDHVAEKSGKFDAWSGTAGNFSFVLIERGKDKFVGVSKRNPEDKQSPSTGMGIAATRAYRAMCGVGDLDCGYSRQRPVTKKQAKEASIEYHTKKGRSVRAMRLFRDIIHTIK